MLDKPNHRVAVNDLFDKKEKGMKATELRIGNYINLDDEDMDKIHIITSIYIFKYPDHENDALITVKDLNYNNHINLVIPIPLTEAWLLKFRFENNTLEIGKFDNWLEYRKESKEMVIWGSDGSTEGHNYRINIEYVHQLQNLYFALTGEEL